MNLIKLVIVTLFFCNSIVGQNNKDPLLAQNSSAQKQWVDSLYTTMSLKEKVGQLFMLQVFSNQGKATKNATIKLIKDHHIGGLIYSKGGPVRQAKLNNELQSISKLPLLIGMDAEWGLSMRLDSTYTFPWNMTLGAIKNKELIERVGQHIGEHCKRIGVHFNFAPVVDINTNPNNPIIGNRSFGQDRNLVTAHAMAFMKGMQSTGVLANAKHFPGHGDTNSDSHKTLPTVNFTQKRIDSIELYPYKKLITGGLSSVMVAHLNVPSLEPKDGYPSSLSKRIVTNLLKETLNFKGLIFTDALNMKGASNFAKSGAIDLAAFKAGNDVLLISENIPIGISAIIEAYQNGDISEERLEHSVKKILKAKYKVGLSNYKPVGLANLTSDLNRKKDDLLYEELIENALTVIKNDNQLLPLQHLDDKNIAYVTLGDDDGDIFFEELKKYTKITKVEAKNLDDLLIRLKKYNTVIIGFHKSNSSPWKSYKFKNKELVWLQEIARTHTVLLNIFAKPYALLDFKTTTNINTITVAYQNSKYAQQKTAQLLFGAIAAKGQLPVSCGSNFNLGTGITTTKLNRLGYTTPERVGINSKKLHKIDSVAQYAISKQMTPGIQMLVARKGHVIYNKSFGKHTYTSNKQVAFSDLYDVASLTKILATLPLIMELEEQGQLSLNSKLSELKPEFEGTNKANVTLKKMMSHYAKFKPWIPFYKKTMDSISKKPNPKYYKKQRSDLFNIKVANNLFLRTDYQDSIQEIIKDSDMLSRTTYRYSDLPYYILKDYIESTYNTGLDKLVQSHFYKSLGANYTTYNPLEKFKDSQIIPSEVDNYFRYQEVHGYVHDMGAAMQNGIGAHAGIFSNANDVAKIMQMYLQKGVYGGKRYFKEETINKFNTCYYCENDNRRGVGFDKPQLGDSGPTCGCLSQQSFGHSGFTGTYAWADPEEEIVYVFLANRTHPTSLGKNLLLRENIRTEIQQLIYDAIED